MNSSELRRLDEIRKWRSRFYVPDGLKALSRNQATELEGEASRMPVFQHTMDDYDFLLGLIDAADNEV